jgi:hypothetical protein
MSTLSLFILNKSLSPENLVEQDLREQIDELLGVERESAFRPSISVPILDLSNAHWLNSHLLGWYMDRRLFEPEQIDGLLQIVDVVLGDGPASVVDGQLAVFSTVDQPLLCEHGASNCHCEHNTSECEINRERLVRDAEAVKRVLVAARDSSWELSYEVW